jgi:hypothetical protein
MINADMRLYDFYIYQKNEYGQTTVQSNAPAGQVKLAIYTTSQNAQGNILYKDAAYVALTHDTEIDDMYQIDYEGERLKVLYVSPLGRLRQVFLARVG